jgi:hypothetical protein
LVWLHTLFFGAILIPNYSATTTGVS